MTLIIDMVMDEVIETDKYQEMVILKRRNVDTNVDIKLAPLTYSSRMQKHLVDPERCSFLAAPSR